MSVSAALLLGVLLGGVEAGSTQWVELERVEPATETQGGNFGASLDADGTALAIGSPTNGNGTATVILFSQSEQAIEQTYELSPSDGDSGDLFGAAVAIGGLPEGGGLVFVGAFAWDVHVEDGIDIVNAGAVYMYSEPEGDGPLIETMITLDDPEGNQWFGYSMSFDGLTLAVGAPRTGTADTVDDKGVVYVYEIGVSGEVGTPVMIESPSPAQFGVFGESIAIDGDRLAVAELYSSAGATYGGAVHLYERTAPETWVHVQTVVSDDPATQNFFGNKVDLSGDTLVVGEFGYDSNPDDPDNPVANDGLVHVFDLIEGSWTHTQRIECPFAASDSLWGSALDLEDSYLIVGSRNWTGNAFETGFVAALSRTDDLFQFERLFTRDDATDFSQTGWAVVAMPEIEVIAVGCTELDQSDGGKVLFFGPSCNGDAVGDRKVGLADLLELLSRWADEGIYAADMNQDYVIGVIDLLLLLEDWNCEWEDESGP